MGGTFGSGKVERHVSVATRTAHHWNGQIASGRKHVSAGQAKFTGDLLRSYSVGVLERRSKRGTVFALPDVGMGEKSLV